MHDDEVGIYITKKGYIHLSKVENELLKLLIKNKGSVVSYKAFCEYLYECKLDNYCKASIRVNIDRLKAKIKDEVSIKTKRGRGYYLE